MYARVENREHVMSATYGKPERDVLPKMAGALPTLARPSVLPVSMRDGKKNTNVQSARELVYKSLDAADHADVRRAALIT